MKITHLLTLGALLCAGGALANGDVVGDPAQGKLLAGQCRTCHGIDGFAKIPIAPHIGGEPASYLAAQLTAFRDGQRMHEMMTVVAKSLSDAQINDLAAWYSAQEVTATLSADPANAPEACTGCHGADGIGLAPDVPNLAAESNIYIDTQLKAFRSGKRVHAVMSMIAADLSDDDIRSAADWYGAIGLSIAP